MLSLEVELLTGRYVATAYNTRLEGEWPPHPARLFSALVATHFAEPEPVPAERALLEWLEGLGPPRILASEASSRDVVTVYVPVNDAGLTDVDAEAASRDEALQAAEAARCGSSGKELNQAERELTKAESKLAAAISRNVDVPKGRSNPMLGARVLPEQRVRQPRTLPSRTPHVPRVTYVWPDAEPTEAQRDTLAGLLRRLVRLGHSSSFVSAWVSDAATTLAQAGEEIRTVWRPALGGESILRAVQPGQLAALEGAHALHRESEPRVMPARFVEYTRLPAEAVAETPRSVFSNDWIVLKRVGGPTLSMVMTAIVARTTRRALMSYGEEAVPEMLSGHDAVGKPLDRDHLAIVPLPFVGHTHAGAALHGASGSILGVALVLPHDASEEERRAVFLRLAEWEKEARMEDEDTPRLTLKLGAAGILELERIGWGSVGATLRPGTWSHAACTWSSATPVALDRNPGNLRSRDPEQQARALAEAEESLVRACRRIGLPEPLRVDILPAAPLSGAAKAQHFPPFPEAEDKLRRVLTHARLEFAERVQGPILIGAGRYQGLGLFRPELNGG